MASFDSINYSIRPNKVVERKIVFAALAKISRVITLHGFRYIGLGSLWFVDFLMAHRWLGISDMVSIEASEIGFRRSEFNRPLSCIAMIKGESTLVIPDLDVESKPSLIWLDYDSGIAGPALTDISMLAGRCAPNSIVIVTVNAKPDSIPSKDENGNDLEKEEALRRIAGDLIAYPIPPRSFQRTRFPKLICTILENQFKNATVMSGRAERFVKLFEIEYADGTPMVTVGGIWVSGDKYEEVFSLAQEEGWEGIVAGQIAVPPLTPKEKIALERIMPSIDPPSDRQMNEIGFQLLREQINAYHKHYLHYPVFGEFNW